MLTPPSHSLELNLILVFIYMASRSFGILEKDVLYAAQSDQMGYLTLYREHSHLKKAHYLLRPINVPFKNKWLRDRVSDFHNKDSLPMSSYENQMLLNRICSDLNLSEQLSRLSFTILSRTCKDKQSLFP